MDFVLFIHQDASEEGEKLRGIIEENFQDNAIQIIRTFNAFKVRLKEVPEYNKEIFILFADSKLRLSEFITLSDLFENRRIILILPDNSKSTLSSAHRLFPRFFTGINDTYEDLCSVLSKMISQEKETDSQEKLNDK